MAFLGKGQGKGLSSAKGNTKCKELALEVYDKASFTISSISFEEGALALLMALRSAEEDRRNVDSDTTLNSSGASSLMTHRKGHRTQKIYGKHDLVDVSCNTQGLGQTTICLHGLL